MADRVDTSDDRLWSPRELARFLGYSESTIVRMVTQQPEKLPPRVPMLSRPRWVPSLVHEWVRQAPRISRAGRPRR